jgi:ATP-dependent protease HslVU (ClpYQ) ATPase subunit
LVKKELEKKTTNNQIEHGEIEMVLENSNENNSASNTLEISFTLTENTTNHFDSTLSLSIDNESVTSASTILTNNDNQDQTTTFESLNQSLVNQIDDNEIIFIDLTNDDLIVSTETLPIQTMNAFKCPVCHETLKEV